MIRAVVATTVLAACGGAPRAPNEPSAPAAAAPARCTLAASVPGADAIGALEIGQAVHHPALHIDGDRAVDLGPAFPALVAGGGRIDAVAPAQVDADAAAELAVLFEQGPLQPDGEQRVVRLAVFDCAAGALTLVPDIIDDVADAQQVQLMGAQVVARGAAPPVTSLSILAAYPGMELNLFELVVGRGTPSWPAGTALSSADAVGRLAAFDTGQQALLPGSSLDYYRGEALPGSGWWPQGGDAVYLSLRRDQDPEHDGTTVRPLLVARMTTGGVAAADAEAPAWAFAGVGAMPAWCAAAPAQLACRAIPADTATPLVDAAWIAGVWASAAEARAALTAAGAPAAPAGRWIFLGGFEADAAPADGGLPLGPDGRAPLTQLRLVDGA